VWWRSRELDKYAHKSLSLLQPTCRLLGAKIRVWGEDHAFHKIVLDNLLKKTKCALELGDRCLTERDKLVEDPLVDRTRFDQRHARQSMVRNHLYTSGSPASQFPESMSRPYESVLLTLLHLLSASIYKLLHVVIRYRTNWCSKIELVHEVALEDTDVQKNGIVHCWPPALQHFSVIRTASWIPSLTARRGTNL
jgi:hypothetical protein